MFRLVGRSLDILRTAVYYYMYAILGVMMSIPGPTLIDLEHSSQTDAYGISFIYIARSTGYLIGSLIGGIVLDCIPREEAAFFVSSLTIAVGAVLIPFCRNLPLLLITFVVTGFAIGFSNTGCNGSCLRIWGIKSAPILQGLHLLYGIGALFAPLIAAPFLQEHLLSHEEGITDATLPTTVPFDFLPLSSLSSVLNQTFVSSIELSGYPKTAIEITSSPTEIPHFLELSTISSVLNQAVAVPLQFSKYPTIATAYIIIACMALLVSFCFLLLCIYIRPQNNASNETQEAVSTRNQGNCFTIIVVVLACLLTGISSGVEVSFTQMLTSYVVISSHRLSKSKGSFITSVYWGTFTATRFLSVFLTTKFDIRKILVFVLILSVSASIVLLTIGTWSVAALWVGAAMLGIAMAPIFPGILAWVERYININNRIASVFTLVSCLLEMIVPFTISTYLKSFPSILFTFLTGATILASILFLILNVILNRKGEKYQTSEQNQTPNESKAVIV